MRTVRSWGITAVREMARHRLRRLEYIGARQLPRGAQALSRTRAAGTRSLAPRRA